MILKSNIACSFSGVRGQHKHDQTLWQTHLPVCIRRGVSHICKQLSVEMICLAFRLVGAISSRIAVGFASMCSRCFFGNLCARITLRWNDDANTWVTEDAQWEKTSGRDQFCGQFLPAISGERNRAVLRLIYILDKCIPNHYINMQYAESGALWVLSCCLTERSMFCFFSISWL